MAKVFVLEVTKHEVDSTRSFGSIVYLFDRAKRTRSSIWSREFKRDVLRALEEEGYNPAADYLLGAGHNVALIIALCAAQERYGQVQALLFCATERTYVPTTLGEGGITCSTEHSRRIAR